MAGAVDPTTGLTPQMEAFCQALASVPSVSQFAACQLAYNWSPDTPRSTIDETASRLVATPKISARIQQLRAAAQASVAAEHAWTLSRMVTEAERQLSDAREGGWRGVASGNGALGLIAKVTGLLQEKPREQGPVLTRVVVVLNHGTDGEGRPRIVEAEVRELTAEVPKLDGDSER